MVLINFLLDVFCPLSMLKFNFVCCRVLFIEI